jgi:hypothetical protein
MPLPTMPLKRKVRTDALAQMQDTGAIKQAVTPAPEAPKAPTLGRPYRPAPITGKVQGALPAAPQAPQRMAFGGQPAAPPAQAPREPGQPNMGGTSLEDLIASRSRRNQQYADNQAQADAAGGVQYSGGATDAKDANDKRVEEAYADGSGKKPGVTAEGQAQSAADRAQADRDALDQQIRDFVSGRVSGANEVDTTEQEALIRDLVEGKTGAALVDARARGGRAGFGASGAQMAIEGDIRKQAGQAASGDILDLRRTEQQRAFDNATQAIQTESGMRSAASDDALRRMFLESLQAESGLETQDQAEKEADFVDRRDSGLGAGVPMPGQANADGSVTNTATGKSYSTSTMEEALSSNWVYGGASFTAGGKTYKVYTDAQGKKHAVEAA